MKMINSHSIHYDYCRLKKQMEKKIKNKNLALEIVAVPFGLIMELLLRIIVEFFVASVTC